MGKLAAVLLLFGMTGACVTEAFAMTTEPCAETNAQENGTQEAHISGNSRVTYVYHQHIGSSEEEGGCYHGICYHTHKGNEAEGGACYKTPVYHVHNGDEQNGGECYGTVVCHQHTGDPQAGGGCYKPVYHSHGSDCYKTVSSSEYGCSTVRWWDTSDGDYEGHDYKYFEMSCGITVHGTNSSHSHTVLTCNKSGVVERYTLGCGKTEETVESYAFDCEKEQGVTVDSYALDCGKTEQTIDGYLLSCGKDEETPCGRITVTEQQGTDKGRTQIEICFEDLTEGGLQLDDNPYTWTNAAGNTVGTGNRVTVSENGTYYVSVGLLNEDINRNGLKAEIAIDSIVKPRQEEDKDSLDDGHGGDESGENNEGDGQPEDGGTKPDQEITPAPAPTTVPTPTATAKAAPDDSQNKNSGKGGSGKESGRLKKKITEETEKIRPVPSKAPKLETERVRPEEKKSENTELPEIKSIDPSKKEGKLRHFFASPVVQIVSITTGTLAAVGGFFLLFYLLFMTVRVYNDNGEGKMTYLGRSRIILKEEGYTVEISERMLEKAVTNRYCLKPGAFRLFKSDEEEILVCCRQKKISAILSREMIVVV